MIEIFSKGVMHKADSLGEVLISRDPMSERLATCASLESATEPACPAMPEEREGSYGNARMGTEYSALTLHRIPLLQRELDAMRAAHQTLCAELDSEWKERKRVYQEEKNQAEFLLHFEEIRDFASDNSYTGYSRFIDSRGTSIREAKEHLLRIDADFSAYKISLKEREEASQVRIRRKETELRRMKEYHRDMQKKRSKGPAIDSGKPRISFQILCS